MVLQGRHRVRNWLFRRVDLERSAAEGESPVVEKQPALSTNPEYRRTRGTRWEAGRTTFQG